MHRVTSSIICLLGSANPKRSLKPHSLCFDCRLTVFTARVEGHVFVLGGSWLLCASEAISDLSRFSLLALRGSQLHRAVSDPP